jgi:gas vesicle protein
MAKGRGSGLAMLGMLIGAMVGAGVTLLLLPKSGEKTREELLRRSHDLTDIARRAPGGLFQTGQATLTETAEQSREAMEDIAQAAKQQASVAADSAAEALKPAQDVTEQLEAHD